MTENTFATISVLMNISQQRVEDLLCGAIDPGCGSSYYWIEDIARKGDVDPRPEYLHEHPFRGGALVIVVDDYDGSVKEVNRETLEAGLAIMAKSHPKHMADFLAENDDADTSDVFLQCVVLGKVIFG